VFINFKDSPESLIEYMAKKLKREEIKKLYWVRNIKSNRKGRAWWEIYLRNMKTLKHEWEKTV